MTEEPKPSKWPFEVVVSTQDGEENSQYARDNGDGTVTYLVLALPAGFIERTVPKDTARLKVRPWETARRWLDLFEEVYGPHLKR